MITEKLNIVVVGAVGVAVVFGACSCLHLTRVAQQREHAPSAAERVARQHVFVLPCLESYPLRDGLLL